MVYPFLNFSIIAIISSVRLFISAIAFASLSSLACSSSDADSDPDNQAVANQPETPNPDQTPMQGEVPSSSGTMLEGPADDIDLDTGERRDGRTGSDDDILRGVGLARDFNRVRPREGGGLRR